MKVRGAWLFALILTVGCGAARADLDLARARFAEGKVEEGLAALERACLTDPGAEGCLDLDRRRAEVDIRVARAEMERGDHIAADVRLLLALTTPHEPTRAAAAELRASPELEKGLAAQRMLLFGDHRRDRAMIEKLAAEPGGLGAQAKAIVEKERVGWLVGDVELGCDPAKRPRVSCSESWKALSTTGVESPEIQRARALALAEEKRVHSLRKQAEQFLAVFAQEGKKAEAFDKCARNEEAGIQWDQRLTACAGETYGGSWSYQDISELHTKEHNNSFLFAKLLAAIDDPALVASLSSRRNTALTTGVGAAQPVPTPGGGKK